MSCITKPRVHLDPLIKSPAKRVRTNTQHDVTSSKLDQAG
jgi:hypothetical protein